MFSPGDKLVFKGYSRKKIPRGMPALTVGNVYECRRVVGLRSYYVYVKNDRGVTSPYPVRNFEKQGDQNAGQQSAE